MRSKLSWTRSKTAADKIETDIKEIKPKLDQVYKDMVEVLYIADKIAAMRQRTDEIFEFYTNNKRANHRRMHNEQSGSVTGY
jgi:hypothetical protein